MKSYQTRKRYSTNLNQNLFDLYHWLWFDYDDYTVIHFIQAFSCVSALNYWLLFRNISSRWWCRTRSGLAVTVLLYSVLSVSMTYIFNQTEDFFTILTLHKKSVLQNMVLIFYTCLIKQWHGTQKMNYSSKRARDTLYFIPHTWLCSAKSLVFAENVIPQPWALICCCSSLYCFGQTYTNKLLFSFFHSFSNLSWNNICSNFLGLWAHFFGTLRLFCQMICRFVQRHWRT